MNFFFVGDPEVIEYVVGHDNVDGHRFILDSFSKIFGKGRQHYRSGNLDMFRCSNEFGNVANYTTSHSLTLGFP